MLSPDQEGGSTMTEQSSDLPLGGAFVTLKPLVGVDASQIKTSFDQIAKSLHGAAFAGVVRFTLVGGPQKESFTVALKDGQAKAESNAKKVDLEIITTPDTWLQIALGKLAPLDAFTGGKMRVRGDQSLGQRIMKQLAAGEGRTAFC
jgi:putative sterol carrier protein